MKGRQDADFSHSLTDLMSGLAVMFLLIAVIFMVQSAKATRLANEAAKRAQRDADARKQDADELDKLRKKDTRSIEKLKDLKRKLESYDQIQLDYDEANDPFLLTVRFTNEQLRFPSNECKVDRVQEQALRSTLRELFPRLCDAVRDRDAKVTITLEGHTDRSWPRSSNCGMTVSAACGADCEHQAFDNNVRLSAARAQYVFFQARDLFRDDSTIDECLNNYVVVAGRGQVKPLDPKDQAKNRRVEIKVRVMAAAANRGPSR